MAAAAATGGVAGPYQCGHQCQSGAQTRIAAKCTELAALGAQTSSHHHYVVELILVILKAFPTSSTVAPALVGQ